MQKRVFSLIALPLLGLGLTVGSAMAQDQPAGPPPEGGGRGAGRAMMDPDQQVMMLTKRLNLNDDQAGRIKGILMDAQKQMQAMRQDSTLSQDDRRAKFMSMREDSSAKIKAILNDDQKVQYEEILAKQRERFQQRQQNPNQ